MLHHMDEASEETPNVENHEHHHPIKHICQIAASMIHGLQEDIDKSLLLRQYSSLESQMEYLWQGVSEGDVEVESIAMLRVLKSINCPDLKNSIDSALDYPERASRDLKLFKNMLEQTVMPRQVNSISYQVIPDAIR